MVLKENKIWNDDVQSLDSSNNNDTLSMGNVERTEYIISF